MLKRDDDADKLAIGSAAMQCALKKSRLASFKNCSSIDRMMKDLQAYQGIKNENFWFGMFLPGKTKTRKSSRNFVEAGNEWLINSYVCNLIVLHLLVVISSLMN